MIKLRHTLNRVPAAERGMVRFPQSQIINIHIADARHAGIFPMPDGAPRDAELTLPVEEPAREAPVSSRAGAH